LKGRESPDKPTFKQVNHLKTVICIYFTNKVWMIVKRKKAAAGEKDVALLTVKVVYRLS
jgi:hypothetical protein